LQKLYLHTNSLSGSMPSDICALRPQLRILEVDCISKVNCTCCTKCYI